MLPCSASSSMSWQLRLNESKSDAWSFNAALINVILSTHLYNVIPAPSLPHSHPPSIPHLLPFPCFRDADVREAAAQAFSTLYKVGIK